MLIVLAKAKLGAGALDAIRGAIADMVAASNAEEGCIAYSFTTDVLDPTVLHIVEKWQDETALAAHFGDLDALMEADLGSVQQVPDVGPVVAARVVEYFADPAHRGHLSVPP
jgi:quinol monooxygenase YgiN